MARFERALLHVRNRTLLERLRWGWQQQAERRRQRARQKKAEWWEAQRGQRECFETNIQRCVRMRLYFDSQLCKLIYCKDFEWQERKFLNAFLRPGDTYVDVGANLGLFTLIAALRVGKAGRVYAFEPCSQAYRRLVANVKLNHASVVCHQLALGDCISRLSMNIALDGFDAWNSFASPIDGSSFSVEEVDCVTWDSFAQEHDLVGRVTMMKIDVEGWETRVLAGAWSSLSRPDAPVLQVEFTQRAAQSAGSSCRGLYRLLQKLGYQMFIYDAKSGQLLPEPLRENYPHLNLIAAKQPQHVLARLANRRPWYWP